MALPLLPAAARRRSPHALAVFPAYALLGGALVLLAAVLRWTRVEPAGAAASAAPACPAGMTRVPGDASRSVAPFCVDLTPAPPAAECGSLGKRALTHEERDVAARLDPAYATGVRCASARPKGADADNHAPPTR
jgi:hypothetical protein